jgi:hypothetical protein
MRHRTRSTISASWLSATLPVAALVVLVALVLAGSVIGCTSSDEISLTIDAPTDAHAFSFNRLWGRLAQAAGVEAEGASLTEFHFTSDAAGTVRLFDFQVMTSDGFFLQYTGVPGSKASIYGHRIASDEPQRASSWSVPLDPIFGALDALGLKELQSQLDGGVGGAPLSVITAMRDAQGRGAARAEQRALYYVGSGFVELGPEDSRREFGPTDAALIISLGTTSGSSTRFDDPVYFIVPR